MHPNPSADLLELAPRERTFSVEEYHALVEAGILGEDDRVELLDGRIIAMSPIGTAHLHCVNRLLDLLIRRLYAFSEPPARLSVQNPLRLGPDGEPEPDLVLLRPGIPEDRMPGPEDVLLVIEVADTSLDLDRRVKRPRYAAAGIPECWIVALEEGMIDVCRDPGPEGYGAIMQRGRGDTLTIKGLPDVEPLPVGGVLG